ncbi:hypothetical protein U879_13020 [Defluviimonas sp. 20V17]|uniref:Uncharacterized protein n=1 Tax=Allgaiera indica TaxID=765699 RepID=A0AAN4UQB2_9RHOB|nr:hypothetical protein [Allgaiera indica]KDB03312.1 hypothetical protein U879_13020 [Defluviimonas sp. 20V17]GHE00635.1 hypothetical protein GCM10008024_12940 [Allgaiera indica]SDW58513.1 hypothetical protein SAMN05444006_10521 [Allgaiera indica]
MRLVSRAVRPAAAALALSLALVLPAAARAGTALTFGIYLWATQGESPTRAQYLSIADGKTEIETDGPAGYKSTTHPTTKPETALIEAAIESRMKALTLHPGPAPAIPYVVIEWNFSQDQTHSEGRGVYALKDVPPSVLALQKKMFGATYEGEGN